MTVLDLIAERESIFGPADSDTVVRDSYATSFLLPIPVNFALIYFWVISIPLYKFVTLCGYSRWFETEHASVLHLMKQVSMRGPKQLTLLPCPQRNSLSVQGRHLALPPAQEFLFHAHKRQSR